MPQSWVQLDGHPRPEILDNGISVVSVMVTETPRLLVVGGRR